MNTLELYALDMLDARACTTEDAVVTARNKHGEGAVTPKNHRAIQRELKKAHRTLSDMRLLIQAMRSNQK